MEKQVCYWNTHTVISVLVFYVISVHPDFIHFPKQPADFLIISRERFHSGEVTSVEYQRETQGPVEQSRIIQKEIQQFHTGAESSGLYSRTVSISLDCGGLPSLPSQPLLAPSSMSQALRLPLVLHTAHYHDQMGCWRE